LGIVIFDRLEGGEWWKVGSVIGERTEECGERLGGCLVKDRRGESGWRRIEVRSISVSTTVFIRGR
jgi:hypothetical protein